VSKVSPKFYRSRPFMSSPIDRINRHLVDMADNTSTSLNSRVAVCIQQHGALEIPLPQTPNQLF
jgi:hypothetical protein